MNILAVDTSSERPSAAIARGGKVLAQVSEGFDLGYSEHLFAELAKLLANSGVALGDVDVFGAIRGPGSFTGIRVGMAAIDGLAFARGKPAVGVSALAAIAWQHPPGDTAIIPLIDARHGRFYGAVYRREPGRLVALDEAEVREAASWLAVAQRSPVTFSGPGASKLEAEIGRTAHASLVPVDPVLAQPMVEIIAAGHGEALAPLYLLRTSAEENLRARPAARLSGKETPEEVGR
jgi:tRNA threonylcarbamoyladenosine biosynthesis protein TsaB